MGGAVDAMSFMWLVTPGNRRTPGMQIPQGPQTGESKQRAEEEEVRGRSPRVALDVVLVPSTRRWGSILNIPPPRNLLRAQSVTSQLAQNSVEAAFTCRQIHFKSSSGSTQMQPTVDCY